MKDLEFPFDVVEFCIGVFLLCGFMIVEIRNTSMNMLCDCRD